MIHSQPAILTALALYIGACLLLGFVAYRKTRSLGDFILGGRTLGSWVTAFSAQASDMSGWLLMGLPGLAYLSGFDAVWLALGLSMGTWANWRFVAAKLRARTEQLADSLTLPDYFENRFADRSRVLRTLSAAFILVFFAFYTSSGFVAAGRLFQTLFGLPYTEAMLWGSAVTLAYTFFGGFLAVSWSDVLQGTLMFVALVLAAWLGVQLVGGPLPALDAIAARDPALLEPFTTTGGGSLGVIGVLSLLAWGLGYPGQPHIVARFMAIRRVEALGTARRVAMVWVVVVLAAAVVVGLCGRLLLTPPLEGADSEKVFLLVATQLFHPAIAGICLAGVLAAIMSTAAAQLLVSTSAFAEDFYRGLFRRGAGRVELLWVGRAAVLGIAGIAFWLGLDPDSKVLSLVAWAWAGFGAAFGPALVLSLHWPRMTRDGALAGILVGGLTVIVWPQFHGPLFELYELVPGFLLSTLAIWAVSSLQQRRLNL
jgi:sodium/proline symporter